MMIFFFFSSRIRHTRFSRDWSSDVCSSDLSIGVRSLADLAGAPRIFGKIGERAHADRGDDNEDNRRSAEIGDVGEIEIGRGSGRERVENNGSDAIVKRGSVHRYGVST